MSWPFKLRMEVLRPAVALCKKHRTWNCPTLVVFEKWVPAEEGRKLLAAAEMRFVPPRLRATWDPERDFRMKDMNAAQFKVMRDGQKARLHASKLIYDETGRLLAGTDSGNPFVVAGWSLHEELALLVKAGLNPYQALACATTNPARYLKDGKGTVEVGERADLILLEKNPLEDVAHVKRPLGVMADGRWYTRKALDAMLEQVAASYKRPKDRFAAMGKLPKGPGAHYEVRWNGTVVGEERFVVSRNVIYAQQVNDPPYSMRKTMRLELDESGMMQSLDAVAEDVFGTRHKQLEGKQGSRYHFGMLSAWIALHPVLSRMKEGSVAKLILSELDLENEPEIKRIPTRVTCVARNNYLIEMQREDKTYQSLLSTDRQGWPVRLKTTLQQGTIEVVRKE